MRMQWMKPNATSTWIKNWICQQMIKINEHGCNHDQPCFFPFFTKECPSNQSRKNKMKAVVDNGLKHAYNFQNEPFICNVQA